MFSVQVNANIFPAVYYKVAFFKARGLKKYQTRLVNLECLFVLRLKINQIHPKAIFHIVLFGRSSE